MANPKVGQRVRLHYNTKAAPSMPHHGELGTVRIVGRGKPRNHGVELDGGGFVVVPCGNLYKLDDGEDTYDDDPWSPGNDYPKD